MKRYELKSMGAIREAMRDGATVFCKFFQKTVTIIEARKNGVLICDDSIERVWNENRKIYVNLELEDTKRELEQARQSLAKTLQAQIDITKQLIALHQSA